VKPPDIPDDEPSRLTTLHALNVLDTPAEERFDRLTRMANRLFDVPIALVSLVDENRQWFKSCVGLDASETSRSVSFCGHAILGNHIFLIEDATQDPRFADNPLVVGEPHIRFYACCPLRAVNGHKLGTLCIIDRKPRTLNEEDRELLEDLASMVERELAAMELATVDELTNIANRRGFMTIAQSSLHLCQREDIPAALVFFDLDDFKPINDQFGHPEGDLALANFADQMAQTFRDSDMIGRLGGDEFVVLLTNSSLEEAEDVVTRFASALDDYNTGADNGYDIRFSHGIVTFDPQRHKSVEDLLAEGDALMYRIKQAKKK